MTKLELKNKPWYKPLVVVYIFCWIACFSLGMVIAHKITDKKIEIVNYVPNPMYLTKVKVKEKLATASTTDEQRAILTSLIEQDYKLEGYENGEAYKDIKFTTQNNKYDPDIVTFIFTLTGGGIGMVFVLIKKIFFHYMLKSQTNSLH